MRSLNLQDYVDIYHESNKAAFARSFDRLPQNISKLFNSHGQWLIIIEGDVHSLVQIRKTIVVD